MEGATHLSAPRSGWGMFIAGLAMAGFLVVLLRTAWLCDDAYISYRTVDNIVNGYGPRWNVAERVQAYTHPLWMALHVPVYFFTREAFFTGIAISIAVSIAAVALFVLGIARSALAAMAGLLVLVFSRAFVDYSTSGLENPLTHLLLALFALVLFREPRTSRGIFLLSLFSALGAINRMDTILLTAPAIAVVWLSTLTWRSTLALAAGLAPFAAWEIFCVIYYGFPFPNTAYAKLGTGLGSLELARQGLYYFQHTILRDPLTLLIILIGLAAPLVRRDVRRTALAAGVFLYLLYIVKIGGDFMGGRFFTAPLFVSVLVLFSLPPPRPVWLWAPILAGTAALGLISPNAPVLTGPGFGKSVQGFKDAHGIGDERRFWYQSAGLGAMRQGRPMPAHKYADTGRQYRAANKPRTVEHGSVGFRGYFGGPLIHIVDYYALTDPLLARLPARYAPNWRIGHFTRVVPKGYVECAAAANPAQPESIALADKNLAKYYEQLIRITRGPIWSAERWKAIWQMNTGAFDALIDTDAYRFPGMSRTTFAAHTAATDAGPVSVGGNGLHIALDALTHAPRLHALIAGPARFILMRGSAVAWTADAGRDLDAALPADIAAAGYDAIRVFPLAGGDKPKVGAITLGE